MAATNQQPMFNKTFWYLLLLISLVVLCSRCDCNYHLKKAKQKCNKSLLTDTVYKKDTTFIRSVETNTVFHYSQKDTVVVKEGRLTVKYFYNSHDSTVFLSGKCDTIKIIKEIPVQVNNTELKPSLISSYWMIIIGLVLIAIAFLFRR
jgi:hypothetical protein